MRRFFRGRQRPSGPANLPLARRFGLLDAMILVGVTAAGLAATRPMVKAITWRNLVDAFLSPPGGWSLQYALLLTLEVGSLTTPMALAWTLAILASGLSKPRSPWRRIMRRPGLVAGLAIVPPLILYGAAVALFAALIGQEFASDAFPYALATIPGVAVAGAWTTLIAGGRWRAEATWIDRLGRLFGAYWLLVAMSFSALLIFWR